MEDTKRCPYCSEEILASAKKCKHCGEYLDMELKYEREIKSNPQEIKVENKEGCFLQTLNVGCAIILGIIALIIILFFIGVASI